MDKIGIKLANSEFYPILDHGRPARKRLVVTTVNDDQKSVQIDLYRGEGPMVTEAAYVGSLVVEDIPAGKAGEPDVRLDLELDENDMLRCTAVEAETGATQSIRVSLESLGEENSYEIPDFDLGGEDTDAGFDEEETDDLPSEATSPEEGASLLAVASELREEESKRSPLLIILAALAVLLILGVLVWFLFLRPGMEAKERNAAPTVTTSAPQTPAPAPAAQPAPAPAAPAAPTPGPAAATSAAAAATPGGSPQPPAAAPAATVGSSAGAASKTPAAATPKATAGKRYRIKWGDTLWDLAWVYYRDPWLYTRIAKANHIRNPDYIVSGTWITIPTK